MATGLRPIVPPRPQPPAKRLMPRVPPLQEQRGDPGQPVQTVEQQAMLQALHERDQWGLAMCLITIATKWERFDGHSSWAKLVNDWKDGTYWTIMQVFTLPTPVLASMIKGTLMFDY